jgi:broad specificity phosphatase PhoE
LRKLILVFTFLLASSVSAQSVTPADLTEGGYILYFRHGRAELGRDCKNPELDQWWKSDDPAQTRQLEETGRLQAKVIGQAFRELDIPVGRFLSSEFTRAHDTATFMALKPVSTERLLTPLTAYGELEPRLESLLAVEPEPGTNTVLVAHGHVLPVFENLTEGSAVVFKPGQREPIGTIEYEEWKRSAGDLLFDSQRAEDRYFLKDGILTVRSDMGIGKVTVFPLSGAWPTLTKIRFEYADGRGMEQLEGLRIESGGSDSSGDFRSSGRIVQEGAVEHDLPQALSSSNPSLTIHWVDFYR